MDKLYEALETLHNVCDDNQCEDGCPLYKLCQCVWANSFYSMSEVIEDEFRLDEWSRTQEAKNGETIKMITKEEVLKAWGIISQFCTEQDHCASCPMVLGCLTRFGTKSLETCAFEFINTMR